VLKLGALVYVGPARLRKLRIYTYALMDRNIYSHVLLDEKTL
jgi:hypothetical protein